MLEKIFAPLIDDGYLHMVCGGADVGAYLTEHDDVDTIHMTGSVQTHDTIVFGRGEEGQQRKANHQPILQKPITSELGPFVRRLWCRGRGQMPIFAIKPNTLSRCASTIADTLCGGSSVGVAVRMGRYAAFVG